MQRTRREFLVGLSFTAAMAAFARNAGTSAMPIAFSTLGCPKWDLPQILSFARSRGFAAVELRGLLGNMDLPSQPAFLGTQIAETKRLFAENHVKIACVSSSSRMGEEDPAKRSKEIADARRFIELASALGAPYVRVFGDGATPPKGTAPGAELKARVVDGLEQLGEYAGPKSVTVILESHDNFTSSATLKEVFERVNSQHVALLWDAHHTYATGGEDPEFTVKQIGKWIRHTHLKDSVASGDDRKYVLTGRGTVPVKKQIEALQSIGYRGYLCFEWEKVWHPDLEEPEIAIADYAEVVRGYLGTAAKN